MANGTIPERAVTSVQVKPETLIRLHSIANRLRSVRNRRVTLEEVINESLDAYENVKDEFSFLNDGSLAK